MTNVLLATDADWIFDEISAALCDDDTTVSRVREGRSVGAAVGEVDPDLVILDLQIGSMGGVAAAIDLRHDFETERARSAPILLLLDRDADRWLARQAGAAGWLIKPLDSFRLRRAATAVLAGDEWFEGEPPPPAPDEAETESPEEESAGV